MKTIAVINDPDFFEYNIPDVEIVNQKQYLTDPVWTTVRNVRVFNLSNDYSYQSRGYYVSLLAEARGHKVIPSIKIIQDLKNPEIAKIISEDIDELIQKSLRRIKGHSFDLSIYFGKNLSPQYDDLCQSLHSLFPAPFLRAKFSKGKKWDMEAIKMIGFKEIPYSHKPFVFDYAENYFKKRHISRDTRKNGLDLAILVDPDEKTAPSDKGALKKFNSLASKVGINVDFITKEDYSRIAEYDALFIRVTTAVHHYTYRFARRAQSEGMVVVDDPDSILRCSNKVYLSELLSTSKLMGPKTLIVQQENRNQVISTIGLPCVLKIPDSSFSLGVTKVSSEEELKGKLDNLLKQSDLVIAQSFVPTDYDWRIGCLNGKALFACRYFMAKNHWQIYNWHSQRKNDQVGLYETIPLEKVPPYVLDSALKVTRMIGNGLYGVDIKEIDGKAYIIEVNDNPNIDSGVEDLVEKDRIYLNVLEYFKEKIEEKLSRKSMS
jgi:glutathione synthase/RimK-type ligase-like ATP-grasp enzyme